MTRRGRLPPSLVCPHPGRGVAEAGFVLITVLWLIAILATLVGLSTATLRMGDTTSANRIALTKGKWAAEACEAVAQARWSQHRLSDTANVDLGHGVHCRWFIEDPTIRINLNSADPAVLLAVGANKGFVQALADRRKTAPLEAVAEAAALPGFDSTLVPLLTVDGPGSINLGAAPSRVLAALPGITPEAIERLQYARSVGHPISSIDDLAARLSPPARGVLLAHYADLARIATFTTQQLLVISEGFVDGQPAHYQVELLVVPAPARLAVIRRRAW